MMNRRDFLKISAPLGMTPFLLNSLPVRAFASPEMESLACDYSDRAIVLVYLGGGNDGLNNLIPMEQYDQYAHIRPNLSLPENKLITLDRALASHKQTGLHPGLSELKDIYEQGKLNIIQGVGYPYPNRSHFKSSDILMTGGDGKNGNIETQTGWMGRYLESYYGGFDKYMSQEQPDPLGVILGGPGLGFHTHSQHSVEVALTNVGGFLQNVLSINTGVPFGNLPDTTYGEHMRYITQTTQSLNKYATRIDEAYRKGRNTLSYPHARGLGYQLKMVARLLSGGSRTKIFITTLASFDTHAHQVDASDPVKGWHSTLLKDLSLSLASFQQDLEALQVENRVLTIVFSEFGRKIIENANNGTDHGTLGPIYLMGSKVKPGMTGEHIKLSEELLNGGAPDVAQQLQYDYRQIFGTIIQDWLGARNEDLQAAGFLSHMDAKPTLIEPHAAVDPGDYGCQDISYQSRVDFGELGRIRILQQRVDQWKSVSLKQPYVNPVIILSPVSDFGAQPCTTRVRAAGENGFECKINEWEYMDGRHVQEEICFLVMEAGIFEIESKVKIQAGNAQLGNQWTFVRFSTPFPAPPVVFTHCNSENDSQTVIIQKKEVNPQGFWMRLQSEELEAPHTAAETVGWVAVESDINGLGLLMETGKTGKAVTDELFQIDFVNSYTYKPYFFADMQTVEEEDPALIRYDFLQKNSVNIFLQEETSLDRETSHRAEEVGFMAMEFSLLTGTKGFSVRTVQTALRNQQTYTLEPGHAIQGSQGNRELWVQAYPNPFQQHFELQLKSTSRHATEIQILNATGQEVLRQVVDNKGQPLRIDTSDLDSGMYIVRVASQDQVKSLKMTKI